MEKTEKEMLQLQHRLEEAQARDRVKERKARTPRLIQEGAILEKVLPQVQQMTLEQLENFFGRSEVARTLERPSQTVPAFFFRLFSFISSRFLSASFGVCSV